MPWESSFKDDLVSDTIYPRYWFRTIDDMGDTRWGRKGIRLSSIDTTGGWISAIIRQGSSVRHGRLVPRTWRRTHGTLNLAVAHWYPAPERVTRGMGVELMIGFTDEPGEAVTVWCGTVRNVRRRMPNWVIECVDMPGSLITRPSRTPGELVLFNRLATGTVGLSYTVISTTIDVDEDFPDWERETSQSWLLRVTPDNGEPHFIKAGTRTLVSGSTYRYGSLTKGYLESTDAGASVGNLVEAYVLIEDEPLDILRKILVSTGIGNNGSNDKLPKTWGFGLPKRFVDGPDIEHHKNVSKPASGSNGWALYTGEKQRNGYGFLETFVAHAGLFIGLHEGKVTCRAVQDPTQTRSPVVTITENDIGAILDWQAWSNEMPTEYYVTGGVSLDGTTEYHVEASMDSMPVTVFREVEFPYIRANEVQEMRTILKRTGNYWTRIAEQGRILCRGWRLADVAPGDVVEFRVSGDLLRPRYNNAFDRYDQRKVLVIGGGPDWFNGDVEIEFLALPQREVATDQSADPGQGNDAPGLE